MPDQVTTEIDRKKERERRVRNSTAVNCFDWFCSIHFCYLHNWLRSFYWIN